MHLHSHITNNSWFLIVVGAEFAFQYFIVEFPLLQVIFRTESLTTPMHITSWVFGVGAIIVNLAAKKVFDNEDHYAPKFKINMTEDLALQADALINFSNKYQTKLAKRKVEEKMCESFDEYDHDHSHDHDHSEPLLPPNEEERKYEEMH